MGRRRGVWVKNDVTGGRIGDRGRMGDGGGDRGRAGNNG